MPLVLGFFTPVSFLFFLLAGYSRFPSDHVKCSVVMPLPCVDAALPPHMEGGLPSLPGQFDWMKLSNVLQEKDHKDFWEKSSVID